MAKDNSPLVVSWPATKNVMHWARMFSSGRVSPVCLSTPVSIRPSRSVLSAASPMARRLRNVDQTEVINQTPAVRLERLAIAVDKNTEPATHLLGIQVDHVIKANDQRRITDDLPLSVDDGTQLPDRLQAVAGACLRHRTFGRLDPGLELLQLSGAECGLVIGDCLLDFQVRIPHGEDRLSREGSHCSAVALHGSQRCLAVLLPGKSVLPSRYDQARCQSLDIPFEWAGQGLVKVIDVEHQATLRRGVRAEVRQVGIAAQLSSQPWRRRPLEIRSHDQCCTAVERER